MHREKSQKIDSINRKSAFKRCFSSFFDAFPLWIFYNWFSDQIKEKSFGPGCSGRIISASSAIIDVSNKKLKKNFF